MDIRSEHFPESAETRRLDGDCALGNSESLISYYSSRKKAVLHAKPYHTTGTLATSFNGRGLMAGWQRCIPSKAFYGKYYSPEVSMSSVQVKPIHSPLSHTWKRRMLFRADIHLSDG